MDGSPYSIGFKSQTKEISVDNLSVEGSIPGWLKGSLIRTAPSLFEVGKGNYKHWFDGLAMIHKFTFRDDRSVSYSCKFLESNSYTLAKKKNKIVLGEFGTDPCRDLFQKVASFFQGPDLTDNGCVNINKLGNSYMSTTETPKLPKFDTGTLDTISHYQFKDQLEGQITTVHPHKDEEGTVFSYLTKLGYKTKYQIYSQANGSAERKLIASIPTEEAAYMHSIGMTEKYVILTEFPLVAKALSIRFSQKPFIENYKWKPERGTLIHRIDKKTGKVQTFKTEPFFCFHHVNAFEEGEDVVFDLVGYDDSEIIQNLYLDYLRSGNSAISHGKLWRFRIAKGAINKSVLSEASIELPRTNYLRVNARPYRYVFGAGASTPGSFFQNIIKVDVTTRQEIVWVQKDCYPGEPVFVENPEAQTEDDGVLLSVVLDGQKYTSFLLILDARTLTEIARAYVPQHITFGFHGQYFDESQLLEAEKTVV